MEENTVNININLMSLIFAISVILVIWFVAKRVISLLLNMVFAAIALPVAIFRRIR